MFCVDGLLCTTIVLLLLLLTGLLGVDLLCFHQSELFQMIRKQICMYVCVFVMCNASGIHIDDE